MLMGTTSLCLHQNWWDKPPNTADKGINSPQIDLLEMIFQIRAALFKSSWISSVWRFTPVLA
jgi:hypothetical protein